jgi:hypothetical protein
MLNIVKAGNITARKQVKIEIILLWNSSCDSAIIERRVIIPNRKLISLGKRKRL